MLPPEVIGTVMEIPGDLFQFFVGKYVVGVSGTGLFSVADFSDASPIKVGSVALGELPCINVTEPYATNSTGKMTQPILLERAMLSRKHLLAICAFLWSLSAWPQQQNLLIYCGITLVKPVTELVRIFETREDVKFQVAQGGSEDLYQSAKKSRLGDLYLPGEPSFREKHLAEGLLGDFKLVGYNQMAIVVQKGNPKHVKGDLNELLRKDLTILIGNAESGSVGQETKTMLEVSAMYTKVVEKAAALMPDSRAINFAMKRGEADAALNWRATSFFPENATHLEAVDLDPKIAKPQALLLMQLTFSTNPLLARKFIDFVASDEGQAVFRKHGFLGNTGAR